MRPSQRRGMIALAVLCVVLSALALFQVYAPRLRSVREAPAKAAAG